MKLAIPFPPIPSTNRIRQVTNWIFYKPHRMIAPFVFLPLIVFGCHSSVSFDGFSSVKRNGHRKLNFWFLIHARCYSRAICLIPQAQPPPRWNGRFLEAPLEQLQLRYMASFTATGGAGFTLCWIWLIVLCEIVVFHECLKCAIFMRAAYTHTTHTYTNSFYFIFL